MRCTRGANRVTQQILQGIRRPVDAVAVFVQIAHEGDFAAVANPCAVQRPAFINQGLEGVDAGDSGFNIKHGDRLAADLQFVNHAGRDDRGAAPQPIAAVQT